MRQQRSLGVGIILCWLLPFQRVLCGSRRAVCVHKRQCLQEHRTVFHPGFCALFDCSALLQLKAATEGHHNNVKKSGDQKKNP